MDKAKSKPVVKKLEERETLVLRTNKVAFDEIAKEAAQRNAKTERLRQARLKREEEERQSTPETVEPKRKKRKTPS